MSIHTSFIWYDDGSSMASWISGGYATNNATVVSTRFTAAELDDILFCRKSQDSPDPVAEAGWQIVLDAAAAAAVRLTLECEAMRWIYNEQFQIANPPDSHALVLLQHWGTNTAEKREKTSFTRNDVKTEARESRLLNDIPPPVITISGDTATITRNPGVVGVIYVFVDGFAKDPKSFVSPEFTPGSVPFETRILSTQDHTVAARIFGPDLDGEYTWSALSTYTNP